ncbi:MAG: NADH-quinone oxidoreductase subunit E [Firmicutes bacterium]|nr:NADH-quinone oxidoreductase subunit E [Bacillota bacterium]
MAERQANSSQRQMILPFVDQPGGLLKALHALQNASPAHFLAPSDLKLVAEVFGVPEAKVWGTATFYSLYSTSPRGRHIIRVCESAPCYVVGAMDILKVLEETLDVKPGETTGDGRFTLEVASCLGVCGVAPALMVDLDVHGNLTRDRLNAILAEYA